jgi:hypothetical protein
VNATPARRCFSAIRPKPTKGGLFQRDCTCDESAPAASAGPFRLIDGSQRSSSKQIARFSSAAARRGCTRRVARGTPLRSPLPIRNREFAVGHSSLLRARLFEREECHRALRPVSSSRAIRGLRCALF